MLEQKLLFFTDDTVTHGTCDEAWSPYGDSCYRAFTDTKMSWYESEAFCKAQGAELASCLSNSDAHFISSMTRSQKDKEFWIGINQM